MSRPSHGHHAPTTCPVCAEDVLVTRVSCEHCETELSGRFLPCEFCGIEDDDRDILREFLSTRGNVKQLSRHLGVSYPTARARLDEVLVRLGFVEPDDAPTDDRLATLEALSRGELDLDEAAALLDGDTGA